MFAPKVAKPQTKAAAVSTNDLSHQRPALAAHPPGDGLVEQALFLQRTIGNQATLRYYADLESMTAREAPRGDARDFSKIPIYPPDRPNRPQARSSFSAPLPGVLQLKLAVGAINDPLEHEADAVAEQVMRTPDSALSISTAPPQSCRKCAACEEDEKGKTLQTKPAGSAEPAAREAPPIVHDVLRSSGQPLDADTRAFMEPRFGHDFGAVRVHTDDLAAKSAEAVNARAYTVGSHVVFRDGAYAPGNSAGLRLMSHELAHVVQQSDAPAPDAPTNEGVAIGGRTQPTIQRDIDFKDAVPKLGEFILKGKPYGEGLGAKEEVTITFSPDPDSPVADTIDFVQIAKGPGVEKPGDWAKVKPEEKLKSDTATTVGFGTHQTQQGDTLASVSLQHFGTAEKAAEIFDKNRRRLVWWSAQSGGQQNDPLTRPLPVGLLLSIPDAIHGGFMVDIYPIGVSARSKRDEPNISPNYEKEGAVTGMGSDTKQGYKHADGSRHDAQMNDFAGGGAISGWFEFESAAFAKDIGLHYGAVRWKFYYSSSGITNESAKLAPKLSDTFNAAMASFNRVYKNKHIVQQGETLNSISIMYFGSTADAHRIYLTNRTNPALTTDDPTAPIKGGTQLDVGIGPSVWDKTQSESGKK